jgi:glycosyltransferase involved in cell wall biosynthesis
MSPRRAKTGKPRLAFYLPGLATGGAERHTVDLRRRLAALGYDTRVIVHSEVVSPAMREMPGAEDAQVLGLRGIAKLSNWMSAYRAFRQADADIIFVINPMRAIWGVILRALGATRAKIVCVFHSTVLQPPGERRLPMFRMAAPYLDVLVYVSRNQQAYWTHRKLRARRSLTIVNGVDLGHFSPLSEQRSEAKARLGLSPDSYVVGLLAAFRPEKNHIQLVEAAAALRRAGTPIELLLVGDGVTRKAVEAKVAALGIGDSVLFAGEYADVRPVVAAFDVGVLCSAEIETFSLASLELLASGIPMVMSNVGGASEIVEQGVNGFLYDPADLDALVAHLAALADPRARETLQAGARSSVAKYSIEAMLNGYVDLIDQLKPAVQLSLPTPRDLPAQATVE